MEGFDRNLVLVGHLIAHDQVGFPERQAGPSLLTLGAPPLGDGAHPPEPHVLVDYGRGRGQPPGALYVFQQHTGGTPRAKTRDQRQHLAACQRAGVDYFPCICYRNFYAWELDRAGHPLTYIRDRLGHSKATTTDSYLRQLRGV